MSDTQPFGAPPVAAAAPDGVVTVGSSRLALSLGLVWAGVTHAGHTRPTNQDAYLTAPPVFAVADGLGGHTGGEVASALAMRAFESLRGVSGVDADDVARVAAGASADMAADVRDHPDRTGMATTLSALVVSGLPHRPHVLVVNVGDSRVYRLREGHLVQLTVDHSEVQDLVTRGYLAPEAAAQYPRRHVVTRVLTDVPDRSPDVRPLAVQAGDRYLLCTDGLHGSVSAGMLGRVLSAGSDLESSVAALLGSALAAGGHDNITAVVLDVTGDQEWG